MARTLEIVPGGDGDGGAQLHLGGDWELRKGIESVEPWRKRLKDFSRVCIESKGLGMWDTSLLVFLESLSRELESAGVEVSLKGLPDGVNKLLALSQGKGAGANTDEREDRSFLYLAGAATIAFGKGVRDMFVFMGEISLAFGNMLRGRARLRWRDFWVTIQDVGVEALPIVSLISFLVGLILAFVGGVQLEKFGATIYVADLVGLAMVREMGVVMTGIIMCGRTGAAFAATIGSMKVNQEIDALVTTGIDPIEFVVLQRIVAMTLMMPLLVLFANFVGIFGGLVVSVGLLDISLYEYVNQTIDSVQIMDIMTGVYKSLVFGFLVAATGCLRGMQCGQSSSAVGMAATSAVVTGITSLIMADALFAALFNALGI